MESLSVAGPSPDFADSSSLSYYEYMMAYYIEELFENPSRDGPMMIGDISSWDAQRRPLLTLLNPPAHDLDLNKLFLQSFIQIWFQNSINQMNYEEELTRIGSQLFLTAHSASFFRQSKYHDSLDSIASINEKRGSYRLSIKEKFFNLFPVRGRGKIKEITHKSLNLLQTLRYLLRIFYDFYSRIRQHQQPMELHHQRYSRALRMFRELTPQLNPSTQTNLGHILSLVENFEESSLTSPQHLQADEFDLDTLDFFGDEGDDALAGAAVGNASTGVDPFNPFDEIPRHPKRNRSSSYSDSTSSDARYYLPSPSSSSAASISALSSDPVAMDLNNTLTLIQQQHPHRLEELSRLERSQLFNVLYPQLFHLLQQQQLQFFQTHCYPILKVILAYRPQGHGQQQHSKEMKFYLHYFMHTDLVNDIDRLLHPILPNMAPEDEEDTYLCQVRDPSFFLWLKKKFPSWEDEGHHLILSTFQRFYCLNWHTLVNPNDVTNPCVDYVSYVSKNLLFHLSKTHQFDQIKSLVLDLNWLSAVISRVGIPLLIEQISPFIHDVFIDTALPDTLLPFLLEISCLSETDIGTETETDIGTGTENHSNCRGSNGRSHVTVLILLSSFLRSLSSALSLPPLNSSQSSPQMISATLSRSLAMFLQIRVMNQPLHILSPDLSSLNEQCQQHLLAFKPLFVNRNFLGQKQRSLSSCGCSQSVSKKTVILQKRSSCSSSPSHSEGYWITLIDYDRSSKELTVVEGPPSCHDIKVPSLSPPSCFILSSSLYPQEISDIYYDDSTDSIWISCEVKTTQYGWPKYCLRQYSIYPEGSCFPLQAESLNERFKIDKILHVSSRAMLIFQELKGILEFSSSNGRDFQFKALFEVQRSSSNLFSSSLSLEELRRLERKELLASCEVKRGELFVLQARSDSEVCLWSSRAGRPLAVLHSEVSESTVTPFLLLSSLC
jgi:hypothetical protein